MPINDTAVKKILFQPFERFAGVQALSAGLVIALLAAIGAALFQTRFDGVLDAHFALSGVSFETVIADQAVNLISLFAVFYGLAVILGARGMRPVDMFGTLAAARAPYVLIPLCNIGGFMSSRVNDVAAGIEADPLNPNLEPLLGMLPVLLFTLTVLVWMVALSFNAWKVCTGFKGFRLIGGFIGAFILAEAFSVITIYFLNI